MGISTLFGFALSEAVANHMSIALIIVCFVVISTLSVFYWSRPQPCRNPFDVDRKKPLKPLVTDSVQRDKVLKKGFSVQKVPQDLDAIVIGSGIGGLAAASFLSQAGKKVLVLEQHDQVGGCCHTYIEKGFEFDVGIHYIGQMRGSTTTNVLMEQVTEGQLVWEELDPAYDVCAIGEPSNARRYEILSGKENLRQSLLKSFPKESVAIDKYLDMLRDIKNNSLLEIVLKILPYWLSKLIVKTGIYSMMSKCYQYHNMSLRDTLQKLTDNKELRAVLSYNFGDYGTVPKDASIVTHAGIINHFMKGAYYPRGGASEIAFNIIPVIERSGGCALVRAPVKEILCDESGRAYGVRVSKSTGDIDIKAPVIISNAGVMNTFHHLLPKEVAVRTDIYKLLAKGSVKTGPSMLSLFVGLKGTKEELNLKAQNTWAFTGTDLDELLEGFLAKTPEDAMNEEVPLLFTSFPSAKDSSWEQRYPGKSTCVVITVVPWEWFDKWDAERVKHRGSDYDNLKMGIARQMWNQVTQMYPQVEGKVEYFEVGSPLSNKFYLGSPKGEVYGLNHDIARFGSPEVAMTLRPETGIPGLFLTGQDIISSGFAGGLHGGVLCASKVLGRNLFLDMQAHIKTLRKNKEV